MLGRCSLLMLIGFGAVSLLASPAAAQQQTAATHRVTPAAHGSTAGTLAAKSGAGAAKSGVGPNSSVRINKFNRLRYGSRPSHRPATAIIGLRPTMGWLGIRG
jgi:hypothetical protein